MDRNKDDPALRAQCAGKWRKLVDEMLAYDGTASVFSMEFLSYASPDEAKRITKSLSKAEVHVVLTVRDATGAILPSGRRSRATAAWCRGPTSPAARSR